jgi:hypothetical protein
VTRCAEGDVLIATAELTGRAVVVVTPCDQPAVHCVDQRFIHRLVAGQLRDPAIGGHSRSGLALGPGLQLFRRLAQGSFEFFLGKLRPFDA